MEHVVLVSDIAFIKRGVAKQIPDKVDIDADDLRELLHGGGGGEESSADSAGSENGEEQVDNEMDGTVGRSAEGLRGSAANSTADDAEMEDDDEKLIKQQLKGYDDDEEEEEATDGDDNKDKKKKQQTKKQRKMCREIQSALVEIRSATLGMAGVAMFAKDTDDPYITKYTDSDDEEEKDDFLVRSEDNLVVSAKVDKGQYTLEVRIYNEEGDDFYVHHDYLLEAPPLCIEPFHYDPGSENKQGNLIAVGTMAGAIEVWDLDIVNSVEPTIILGGIEPGKKKNRKKRDGSAQGHTEAVLTCKWNQEMPHILGSGDAEGLLIMWDIDEAKASTVIADRENGGLQSIAWHPVEAPVLLSGSMNGYLAARDCRTQAVAAEWRIEGSAQIEKVLWDIHAPFYAMLGADDGKLRYVDMRVAGKFVHEVDAHSGGVEAIGVSCARAGLVATGGDDHSLAVWSLNSTEARLVHRVENLSLGVVHSMAFSPNSPLILCVGGDAEDLTRIIDLAKLPAVLDAFPAPVIE